MTSKTPPDVSRFEADPEVAGALAALRRARRRAEEIAVATGTALVQAVDGKLVLVHPQRPASRTDDKP